MKELDVVLGAMEALIREFPALDGGYHPKMFKNCVEDNENTFNEGGGVCDHGSNGNGYTARSNDKDTEGCNSLGKGKQKGNGDRMVHGAASQPKNYYHSFSLASTLKEKVIVPRDIHSMHERRLYGNDSDNDDDQAHDVYWDDDKSVATTVDEMVSICSGLLFAFHESMNS